MLNGVMHLGSRALWRKGTEILPFGQDDTFTVSVY
jgi:hypothetical protein